MPSSVHETTPPFASSSFRCTPLEQVRMLFVSFVQGLFAAAPPGDFHWEPEEGNTEIIIRDENPIDVESIGERPAINFTMGPVQFYSLGMDDMLDVDFRTGRKKKGVLVPGTMTVNVLSRVDIEAHNLAWVIAEHIWLLRELFLQKGFFELGRGIQVTPPSPPGNIVAGDMGDESYLCSVSVPWQFARKSAFTPLGRQVIQSIEQRIAVNSGRRVESLGWPADRTGFELPYSLHVCRPESYAPGASDARGGTPDPAGVKNNPLPLQPHPLNPAKQVVVKSVRPHRAGLRYASGGRGAALPIGAHCVPES